MLAKIRSVLAIAFALSSGPSAFASHEALKCNVYSKSPALDKNEESDLLIIGALSTQRKVREGQAILKSAPSDIRPKKDGVAQKLFSPDPIPSPIQYEAKLIAGKSISIRASATIGGGEKETFDLSGPDAPEKDGKFPSLTLRAKLKGALEPEVRFDDKASSGFEIQCTHLPARE